MNIQSGSSSIPSSSTLFNWKFDVFLSFRGEDIRTSFLDHFYHALKNKGIRVFKDDKELEKGKKIKSGLFEGIEESRFSVIIFSENYASSTWCLDEVLKIVECKINGSNEQLIFPIFYKVDPSDVRKQKGSFQNFFNNYEEEFKENIEKVNEWRIALKKVGKLVGWHLKDRHEVEFIEEIVKEISRRLKPPTLLSTFNDLVGIELRVKTVRLLLNNESEDDVHMIGICGMGGLGKTTIARVVYDLISCDFQASSFLANVREETSKEGGLINLQKQLLFQLLKVEDISIWNIYDGIGMIASRLRYKKVLLVIDDVVNVEQLRSLAGDCNWFGRGSRIIITSRDEHLLKSHGVNSIYKPEQLNDDEALQLFCMKAFKTHEPVEGYLQLSEHVVKYTNGLPLALEILGSFLFGRSIDQWKGALERLKKEPERGILDKLQISFDGLNEIDKKIFLDIVCFFKGKDMDYVTKILDGCGFDPILGINVLIERSLITISHRGKLWMHDLLQEMGQQVVKRQSLEEPGKRSRLWKIEDIRHVLTTNTGTEVVEGIFHEFSKNDSQMSVRAETFSKMTKLRLLKIHNVQPSECVEYLSSELRLLEWHHYCLKTLPSSLQLDKTVELNLPYSNIKQLWKGVKTLSNLKLLRLNYSNNLIKTPDFTGVPNLEEVILEGCTKLHEIHPSLLFHKKLMVLDLKDCTSLGILSEKIGMESLRKLVLSGCSKLKKFPEIMASMTCLSELFLDGTAIKELPLSLGLLTGLVSLNLTNCTNLTRLPSTIIDLNSLNTLSLSGCSKFKNASRNSRDLSSSTSQRSRFPISLSRRRNPDPMTGLMLPSLLSRLSFLKKLNLSDCDLDEGAIPGSICNLVSLKDLDLSKNNFVSLPEGINHLPKLLNISLVDCKSLRSLQELPSSLSYVRVDGCDSLETLSDALKLCDFRGINCSKLLRQDGFLSFSMLKRWFFEAKSNSMDNSFSIVVPGSKIPEWFSYQDERNFIIIKKPPYLYNKHKLVGYAISCVFHVDRHQPTTRSYYDSFFRTHFIGLRRYGDRKPFKEIRIVDFDEQRGQAVSDHLWLLYLSHEEHFGQKQWQYHHDYKQLGFLFVPNRSEMGVKWCGVHPVYVHEAEELRQSCAGSIMNVATTSNLRLNYNVGAGSDEASGSGCRDDDEELQPSRFKEPGMN